MQPVQLPENRYEKYLSYVNYLRFFLEFVGNVNFLFLLFLKLLVHVPLNSLLIHLPTFNNLTILKKN